MAIQATNNQEQPQEQPKQNDKELNFRALESKYERIVAQERAEREKMQRELEEIKRAKQSQNDDDEDDEPYVDKRKLEKKLAKFGEQTDKKTETKIQQAVQQALAEERKQNWIKNNPDFYEVMQGHAEKFLQKAPQLAEAILQMPEGFERQQLVYHNIKSLGIDRPEQKQSSVQDKIDANRKSPYYQPSGVSAAPYAPVGDFSDAGKKNAWEQVQKLKANLRLGG